MEQWYRDQLDALPAAVRFAAAEAAPRTNWRNVGRSDEGRVLAGEGPEGRWISVMVTNEGRAIVTTVIAPGEVPEEILAALGRQVPQFRALLSVHAVGPDSQTVGHYSFQVSLRLGENQKFLVSAGSKQVTVGEKWNVAPA